MGKPARIQEPQKNAELPPALHGEEHALGCSLCVKVVHRYLSVLLPWELVLRAAQQGIVHKQSAWCDFELCNEVCV